MDGRILNQILNCHQKKMTNRFLEILNRIAFAGRKIATKGDKQMFGLDKQSKTQRVLKFLQTGKSVTWKTLRTKFDLVSPRALIDKLRLEGNMIYINKSSEGTSYRLGSPSKAIIAAGIKALYRKDIYAYKA